jgi:hypothetical protein
MWDIAWDLLEHRNGVLHEQENTVTRVAMHQLNRSISEAFGKLQLLLLPANDRHLLSISLARLLQKNQTYKDMWLCNASAVVKDKYHKQ